MLESAQGAPSHGWETGPHLRLAAVKALSVLGSTGSIGTQTLELAEEFPDRFRVVALTAGNNLDLLVEQILRHVPEAVALADAERIPELRERLNALEPSARPARLPELLGGNDGLCAAAVGLREGMTPGLVARGLEAAGSVPAIAIARKAPLSRARAGSFEVAAMITDFRRPSSERSRSRNSRWVSSALCVTAMEYIWNARVDTTARSISAAKDVANSFPVRDRRI